MKEASRFYSSLGLLIILNVIIKPIWIFGIDRQVQNTVGTIEYGSYFSLFNLSVVLAFLLDWGLTTFFNRHLASEKEKFIDKVGSFLLVKLLFVLVYTVIMILFAAATGIQRWDILWGVILIQALTFFFVFLRTIITAEQWFRTEAFLSVLDKMLMIVLCGSLLFFPGTFGAITIHWFLRFQVISTAVAVMVTIFILYRRGISFAIHSFSSVWNKKIFFAALPYALLLLLTSAHFRLDGFLLERIYPDGAHEAGIYAASYRLLDAANMIGVLFASFVLPYVARRWSSGTEINSVVLNIRHLLLCLSVTVATIIVFMAPWIHQLLYKHSDAHATDVLQWCLPALIGYSLVSVYGTVIIATGHIYTFCRITFIAVLINVIANILLIPQYGAKGCCIAALISQFFCGITTMIYAKQKLQLSLHVRSLLIYISIVAALSGYFLLVKDKLPNPWLQIMIAGVIALVIIITTRLVDIKKWKTLFRQSAIEQETGNSNV